MKLQVVTLLHEQASCHILAATLLHCNTIGYTFTQVHSKFLAVTLLQYTGTLLNTNDIGCYTITRILVDIKILGIILAVTVKVCQIQR